ASPPGLRPRGRGPARDRPRRGRHGRGGRGSVAPVCARRPLAPRGGRGRGALRGAGGRGARLPRQTLALSQAPTPVSDTVTSWCQLRAESRTSAAATICTRTVAVMGRDRRSVVPGEIYHVWTRSSDDGIAFVDDRDRRDFFTRLTVVARRHVWIVLAWCAMTTHYHLLVELVEATLSEGMKELNGGFS